MARTTSTVIGTNLILSSLLATLSYLPFKLVAKVTLLVCLLVFILDPYPGSRIAVLVAVGGVLLINRLKQRYQRWEIEQKVKNMVLEDMDKLARGGDLDGGDDDDDDDEGVDQQQQQQQQRQEAKKSR